MDTVFADWKSILQDFKDSVEKDLDEIENGKAYPSMQAFLAFSKS